MPKTIPYTKKAYKLLMEGSIALAEVESNGIKVDVPYVKKAMEDTLKTLKEKKEALKSTEVMKVWRKTYRGKTNLNSGVQLGKVLFDVMGFDCPNLTDAGKYKTDEATLETLDIPFVKDFLAIKKLTKVRGTYLKGILRHTTSDGFIHPFFNLGHVTTYRSSSNDPNFQNMPIRDPVFGAIVRKAFVPRDFEWHLIEADYGGVEVKVAACYHKDPTMLSYINDPTKDMHRDMAMECYKLPEEEMTKLIRYFGKNMFVFPQFYGSYWADCSKHLWDASGTAETASGIPLRKWLRKQGLKELGNQDRRDPKPGSFEEHIAHVERSFWKERFGVYDEWKRKWIKDYERKGYFQTKTGFICQGFMKRNEAINYPVQGSAFHCLLQSLIWLQKELKRRKMRTLIIGQIHDSILADVPHEELAEFLALCEEIMVEKLLKEWPWIITPMEVEAEVAPMSYPWHFKKEWDPATKF